MIKDRGSNKTRAKKIKTCKIRERKCLVTGEVYPTQRLIRFVVDPEGRVIPDVAAKLPGRGGWILAEGSVLERAIKKKILVRFGHRVGQRVGQRITAVQGVKNNPKGDIFNNMEMPETNAKLSIRVEDNLSEMVVNLLRQRCLDYLGIANRAGLVISGFERVRSRLLSGKCRTLITAKDAAAGGRRKICSGLGNILDNLRMIDMFTREQLGQTLGLPEAVHVALGFGGITESFLKEFSRYESVILR